MNIEELIRALESKIENIEEDEKSSSLEYSEIKNEDFLFKDGNYDQINISVDSPIDLYTIFIIMLREKYGLIDRFPLSIRNKKIIYADARRKNSEIINLQHDVVTAISASAISLSNKNVTTADIKKAGVNKTITSAGLMPMKTGFFDIPADKFFQLKGYGNIRSYIPMIEFLSQKTADIYEMHSFIEKITLDRLYYLKLPESEREAFASCPTPAFKKLNSIMNKYYYEVQAREEKRKRNLKKQQRKYTTAIEELKKAFEKDVITDLSIVNQIPDEDNRELALMIIYSHNKNASEKLEEKLVEARSNSIAVYQHLLSETGIILTEDLYSKISFRTKEEIEQIITEVNRYGITDSNSICQILISADMETFSNIKELYEKGIISKNYIATNPTLFTETSTNYKNLMDCIKTLKDKDIPYKVLYNNCDVLVVDKKMLEDRLSILEEYDLTKSVKISTDLGFLESENLEELLDLAIEYGYSTELCSNLSILNFSKEKWLRLSILKELDELPKNGEELEEVLNDPNFIVPDHKINEYVVMPTEEYEKTLSSLLQQESLDALEKYTKDSLTYDVNGILISRRKIKRQFSEGQKTSTGVNGYQKNKH